MGFGRGYFAAEKGDVDIDRGRETKHLLVRAPRETPGPQMALILSAQEG
jgi:hypothetical protein